MSEEEIHEEKVQLQENPLNEFSINQKKLLKIVKT
jgi:hypothetical protein